MEKKVKVLIIRNDHIGDLVYSTPIFREIKRAWPNSEITAIVSRLNRPIIEKNTHINKVIELDIPKHNFSTLSKYFKMSKILRKEKFDYGIDLRGSVMNSFFLLYLAGVKNRISHIEYHPSIKHFLNYPITLDPKDHIFNDNRTLLKEGLNIEIKNDWPEIITDKKDERVVNSFIKKNKLNKYICICPIAGLEYKQWNLKNFENLLDWLNKNFKDYKIIFMGIEKDKEVIENLKKRIKNSISVYNYNVRQIVLIFKKSKLVIAHDGGPMHSAWLSGARTLALYPAKTEKFIPLKNSDIFVSKSTKNMNSIKLEKVKKAIKKILD